MNGTIELTNVKWSAKLWNVCGFYFNPFYFSEFIDFGNIVSIFYLCCIVIILFMECKSLNILGTIIIFALWLYGCKFKKILFYHNHHPSSFLSAICNLLLHPSCCHSVYILILQLTVSDLCSFVFSKPNVI